MAKKRNKNKRKDPLLKGELLMSDNTEVASEVKEESNVKVTDINLTNACEEQETVIDSNVLGLKDEGDDDEDEGDLTAPSIPGDTKEEDGVEDITEVEMLIAARKEFFKNNVITSAFKDTICGSIAKIALCVYESGSTGDLQAYLNYMESYPAQISSVAYGMDNIIKNSQRQREEINLMQAALTKIARARRNKTEIKLNVAMIYKDMSNKDVVNFISSLAG